MHESEVEEELYNLFEENGVKVFIAKELIIGEEVVILQHPHLPFAKPTFGVLGVSVNR
ncbi:MAG TPA: hypothetical protein VLR72_01950 [Clostridiaceae bacterium]|nr:hypothetical protein [Clostridiaceae bacterium]